MQAGLYKPGQGYWTRLMSFIAWSTLVAMGGVWLWDLLAGARWFGIEQPVYIQATVAVLACAILAYIGYLLVGKRPKVVDFMVATEGEMKKVNWSSKREIMGMTWVVIGLTLFIALFCLLWDLVFQALFRAMGVLQTAA